MRTCGSPSAADEPDHVSNPHFLTSLHRYSAEMRVVSVNISAVVKKHGQAVAPITLSSTGERHGGIGARANRLTFACSYVHPTMKYPMPITER